MMHGDTPEVVEMLKTLRDGLENQGIKIVPMAELD
jgi:lactam utilization protein B